MKFVICFAVLFLFCASSAHAKFDPSFVWTTIETDHFLIHYHQGEEELAQQAARIAEDVHAQLISRIKWAPKQKTHLVFVDAADFGMGMARLIPYNNIIFFITPPHGYMGYPGDYLRALITHEYTHVLQLDMVHRIPSALQSIFGRIYFPNQFQPVWMFEGLADYEANEQVFGHSTSSLDMFLRMAALEGRLPKLDQMSTYTLDAWPGFSTPYIFGESFIRYLVENYTREKVADISVVYSGRGIPFLVNSTGKKVLNKSYTALWDEWKNALTEKYRKQQEKIQAKGITASTQLTRRGYANLYPAFSPDNSRIAYSVSNADEFPGIYLMNSDGSEDRKLIDNSFNDGSVSWSHDSSRLYYTKIDVWRNTNMVNDIYCYEFTSDKEVRLTEGFRSRDPNPSPDGQKLLFVVNNLGKSRLALVEILENKCQPFEPTKITYLSEESSNQYANPRFSPDMSKIAVTVLQPEGNADIWILDSNGNKISEIARDRAVEGAPVWSPDGKYVYFSSDRTGVFNLYAYELKTKTLYQITNIIGGAFMPGVSPDGKTLAYSSYSARGFDIHTIAVDETTWNPAEPYQDPYLPPHQEARQTETSVQPYSPFSTLYPRYWIPWYDYNSESGLMLGAFTFGQDVLQQHQYVADILYGPESGRVSYTLNYFYDGLYPTIRLQVSDTDAIYADLLSDNKKTEDYVEQQKLYDLSLIIPFIKTKSQHSFAVGYRWKDVSHLTDLPPWDGYGGGIPAEGVLASARVNYLFNNAHRYGYSISPEQGRTIEIGYELFDESLGSDFNLRKYSADWHEYINLPWKHHVLQVRAFAGTSSGDVISQGAYQLGGDSPGDITIGLDSEEVYLRGYQPNAFRGQKAALMSLEYRFPIVNIERGRNVKPFFFERLHGAVFAEAGNVWDDSFHSADMKRSAGVEVRLDTNLGYLFPLTFRMGIANGFDEEGEVTAMFGLWVPLGL